MVLYEVSFSITANPTALTKIKPVACKTKSPNKAGDFPYRVVFYPFNLTY